MRRPRTLYADSPGGKIAYQVVGDGPVDLYFYATGAWQLDMVWDNPLSERFVRRLASFSRLIMLNPRGCSLSDPISIGEPPTMEEWSSDLLYVLDAVGVERAVQVAVSDIGIPALLFAATYPERISALVLVNAYARLTRADDYPWGYPREVAERVTDLVVATHGTGEALRRLAPELADDEAFRDWYARFERATMPPATMRVVRRIMTDIDLRGLLPSIRCPTLVISHTQDPYIRSGHGRHLAQHIPSATYVERDVPWGIVWLHDTDWLVEEIHGFLTGSRGLPDPDDRVLATVLMTDIVGSTKAAAEMGDRRWRELLDRHDAVVRREVERFRGRPVKWTGDGVLATFDGPARAIRCALSLREAVRQLGIEIYTGLHTGEVEQRGDDVGGIAVAIAQRVMSEASPGEVLVSGAVPPLVAGSGIEFADRGLRELKGVPGEWRLFAVG
ncbi:MAG TPA: adenylate/guanylate cyclase domain-containing protein [Actinomycetota bacterium]|nr:adenylate/guanylate cyclase domain-containing protein [Actinomycetota bacterium]